MCDERTQHEPAVAGRLFSPAAASGIAVSMGVFPTDAPTSACLRPRLDNREGTPFPADPQSSSIAERGRGNAASVQRHLKVLSVASTARMPRGPASVVGELRGYQRQGGRHQCRRSHRLDDPADQQCGQVRGQGAHDTSGLEQDRTPNERPLFDRTGR